MIKKCYYCEQEATVTIRLFTNGMFQEVDVCPACAEKVHSFFVNDMLTLILTQAWVTGKDPITFLNNLVSDLQKNKKVTEKTTCKECYEILRTFIYPMLNSIHQTYHVNEKVTGRRTKLKELEKQLKIAVEREQYEQAAKLKAELEQLKKKDDPNSTPT